MRSESKLKTFDFWILPFEFLGGVGEEPTANQWTESTKFERKQKDNRFSTESGVYSFRIPPPPPYFSSNKSGAAKQIEE